MPLGGKLPSVADPPGTSTISALTTNSVGIGKGPGEYVVTLSVKKVDGDWRFQLDVRKSGDAGTGSSGGGLIEAADGKWPNTADWIASGGVSNQAEFSLDQQCLLLDFRAMSKSVTTSGASDQGALLWVALADRPR